MMVNRLRLEVGWSVEGLALTVLVDGWDLSRAWDGLGRDPDALLGPSSPLLPGEAPRHVAVLRCWCGQEGCGSLVARIRRDGGDVAWDDFSEGSEDHPSPDRPVATGPFRFSFDEYERELRRLDGPIAYWVSI